MFIPLADYAGASFSFICTILYARNNIWAWPMCIITNLVNLVLFYKTGIFADAALEIVYLTLAFYGILNWLYGGENNQQREVAHTPALEAVILFFLTIGTYYTTHYILDNHTSSTVAQLDAIAMSLSLLGQWLMCRRYIETWIIWFIADSVLALLFYYKNLPAHLVLNLVYLPITFYGYYTWYQDKPTNDSRVHNLPVEV